MYSLIKKVTNNILDESMFPKKGTLNYNSPREDYRSLKNLRKDLIVSRKALTQMDNYRERDAETEFPLGTRTTFKSKKEFDSAYKSEEENYDKIVQEIIDAKKEAGITIVGKAWKWEELKHKLEPGK